ncbi:MAG: hypothetical protein ABL308_10830 [Oceanicaulis sp.]
MFLRASLVLIATALIAGCAAKYPEYHDPYDRYGRHDPYYGPPAPPRPTEQGAETAQAICSIDSLTEARNEMRTEIERAGYAGAYTYYGPDYGSRERERATIREQVTERPYGPQTETVELVQAFSSDLDAAYRFATSSCQSYQMCMQNQGYQEGACMNSADNWRDARREFTALSSRLAEIRLRIAETCDDCDWGYHRPHHRRGHPHPHPHNPHRYDDCRDGYCGHHSRYEEECDTVLGDVFTTTTCDYRRPSRYRHY